MTGLTIGAAALDGSDEGDTVNFLINPYRFAAAGGGGLSGQHLSVPSNSNYAETSTLPSFTGDVELRFDLEVDASTQDTAPRVFGNYGDGTSTGSVFIGLRSDGRGNVGAVSGGSVSTTNFSGLWASSGVERKQVRAIFLTASNQVEIYTRATSAGLSVTDGTGWSLLTTVSLTCSALVDNTGAWQVNDMLRTGSQGFKGAAKIYECSLHDSSGTTLLHFRADDFTVGDTDGDSAVSSSTSETWTLRALPSTTAPVIV